MRDQNISRCVRCRPLVRIRTYPSYAQIACNAVHRIELEFTILSSKQCPKLLSAGCCEPGAPSRFGPEPDRIHVWVWSLSPISVGATLTAAPSSLRCTHAERVEAKLQNCNENQKFRMWLCALRNITQF